MTGGGSGHLPVFMGYVGFGLADGVAVGNVFASPSSEQILEATREVHGDAGVLYLYGNYSGDVMNFDFAAELAEAEGIEIATVLGADDVASAPKGSERVGGELPALPCCTKWQGRGPRKGRPSPRSWRVPTASAGLRSMGVALSSCVLPAAGHPTFDLPEGEMEIGMGIHGEPGVRRGELEPAERIAEQLLAHIVDDLPYRRGDEVAVLVNGLGATPKEELYILFRSVQEILASAGIAVRRTWVGEYATSLEMAGASVSLLRLDDELAEAPRRPLRVTLRRQKGWPPSVRRQQMNPRAGLAALLESRPTPWHPRQPS